MYNVKLKCLKLEKFLFSSRNTKNVTKYVKPFLVYHGFWFSLETHVSEKWSESLIQSPSLILMTLIPPHASITHSMWYLHHKCFLVSAPDLSDRWPFATKQFHTLFVSCGCLRWWAGEIMDFSSWCTLLNSVMARLQKCMSYCCEALGSANPD